MIAARFGLLALLATTTAAQAAPPSWPNWIKLDSWTDIDEAYRAEFGLCDTQDRFKGFKLPQKIGARRFFGCSSDKNRVTVLRKLAPTAALPKGAVAFTSKLSVDLDGSWFACNTPGKTDLCPTSLMVRGPAGTPVPVSSDKVTYVVIPVAGPNTTLGREFRTRTAVQMGDFGLVVTATEAIPVIVADGGPFNKLGEGSIALHRRLGKELCKTKDAEGRCTTMVSPLSSQAGPFVTILFPGTKRADVRASNIVEITKTEGERLWAAVAGSIGR